MSLSFHFEIIWLGLQTGLSKHGLILGHNTKNAMNIAPVVKHCQMLRVFNRIESHGCLQIRLRFKVWVKASVNVRVKQVGGTLV